MAEQPLDPQTVEALDNLFNAWLVLHGMLSKGGVLYKADAEGELLCDARGNPLKVDAAQFKLLMADPLEGFQAYVAKKGIRLNTVQREYPKS